MDPAIRPFACHICHARFKNKQFLQRHYISHTDERNYSCEICGKTYKYKKGVNRHKQKIHSESYIPRRKHTKRTKSYKPEDFLALPETKENKRENPDLKPIYQVIFTSPFPIENN